jgi:hypothetical protein
MLATCACGCSASMEGKRACARYASDACRARAWKARTGYRRESGAGTARNGSDKPRPRRVARRKGVSVYFASPDLARRALDALTGHDLEPAAAAIAKALERRARTADPWAR